jgi:3-oxoacyl-[acyl-carrier-protein] synthase II
MSSEDRRKNWVAVTGIGMICPLGTTTKECWQNMLKGKSGIRRITRFDASECASQIAGEIPPEYFDLEKNVLSASFYEHSLLPSRLSMMVAKQAVEDAKIDLDKIDQTRAGVITGCGGSTFGDQVVLGNPDKKVFDFSNEMLNALSACVSIEYGFKGPSFNVATACSSGAYAIQVAYDFVRKYGDICLAIGAETMINKEAIDGFCQLMALSVQNEYPEKASRPFDKNRNGFVMSEGGCAVLLESYEHAVQRGARIYALMTGVASTSEAYNIVAPEPQGKAIARTMEWAIRNAQLSKEKVGYVNAHGTSTLPNDRIETKAIKWVFGSLAYNIAISSQKSMIGHSIGAAGAIEFGVTALTLYHQTITPTINYEVPDPDCDLDYVPNQARKVQSLEAAISNSFGFGGHNATLVLEKCDGF